MNLHNTNLELRVKFTVNPFQKFSNVQLYSHLDQILCQMAVIVNRMTEYDTGCSQLWIEMLTLDHLALVRLYAEIPRIHPDGRVQSRS